MKINPAISIIIIVTFLFFLLMYIVEYTLGNICENDRLQIVNISNTSNTGFKYEYTLQSSDKLGKIRCSKNIIFLSNQHFDVGDNIVFSKNNLEKNDNYDKK